VYELLAERAEVDLPAGELWLLVRLGEGTDVDLDDPALAAAHASLCERGLAEDGGLRADGEVVYERVVVARRTGLAELLDGWEPEQHDEVRGMLDRLARQLVGEIPPAPARA
jgi:hypothetical protein